MRSENLRGDCLVELHLGKVTQTEVERIMSEISYQLADRGYNDSEDSVAVVITARAQRFPQLLRDRVVKRFLKRYSIIMIPNSTATSWYDAMISGED